MESVKEKIQKLLEVPDGDQWDHQRFSLLAVILNDMASKIESLDNELFRVANTASCLANGIIPD